MKINKCIITFIYSQLITGEGVPDSVKESLRIAIYVAIAIAVNTSINLQLLPLVKVMAGIIIHIILDWFTL